jgi:hypothetical protein
LIKLKGWSHCGQPFFNDYLENKKAAFNKAAFLNTKQKLVVDNQFVCVQICAFFHFYKVNSVGKIFEVYGKII